MQEIDKPVSHEEEEARSGKKVNPICIRFSAVERVDLEEAAVRNGMTKTDYIKARVFATPIRDRGKLAAVTALHVAGVSLSNLLDRLHDDDDLGRESGVLLADMRRLVDLLAKDVG